MHSFPTLRRLLVLTALLKGQIVDGLVGYVVVKHRQIIDGRRRFLPHEIHGCDGCGYCVCVGIR
jgi:hypothetical protein